MKYDLSIQEEEFNENGGNRYILLFLFFISSQDN
jgi:hypothetical protein